MLATKHVVAAAVVGGAGVVVTDNAKDFPVSRIPADIRVISAREFTTNTVDVDPERAARLLGQIAARHQRPPHTPRKLLDLLVARPRPSVCPDK